MLGSGPAHANGTRLFWKPAAATKAETGTGQVVRSLRGEEAPDFAGGGAPCVAPDVDPDLFHPLGFTKAEQTQTARVIATYCHRCPMQVECYAWGRRVGRGQGIWGGVRLDSPGSDRRRAS